MFSLFLSCYRNTRKSMGELEKAVEILAYRFVLPQHFSFVFPSIHLCHGLYDLIETRHMFLFLNKEYGGFRARAEKALGDTLTRAAFFGLLSTTGN